jgi:CheY-like chemotaxis protein
MSNLDDIKITDPDSGRYMTLALDPEAKQQIKTLMLELMGESVKSAHSGSQAIEIFEQRVKEL